MISSDLNKTGNFYGKGIKEREKYKISSQHQALTLLRRFHFRFPNLIDGLVFYIRE